MATVSDYLTWRADVPFSIDPFGEVDNLILAKLSYTDFRGIVSDSGEAVSIREVRDLFFKKHPREGIRAEKTFLPKLSLMLDDMADGARFSDVGVSYFVDRSDGERDLQFSAVTFLLPDGTAYAAFRGTDETINGWREDFDLSFVHETEGQKLAVEYLDRVGGAIRRPLYVGGHSKGGNLAVYASAFCGDEVRDRIITVWSNDGPGFRREITDSPEYGAILPKVVSIIPDTSLVGQLLNSKYRHTVVKSAVRGIMQHNGMTWEVRRNRFERCEMSPTGRMIGQALGSWLEQIDDDRRKMFTDTLFSLFESTGADTFTEIGGQKRKSAEAILTSVRGLPKDRQREVLRIIALLGLSGGQAATDYFAKQRQIAPLRRAEGKK